ncbi:hypothetical protein LLH03_08895 [bacterium]|nr:hypothetical protein [bacterium]
MRPADDPDLRPLAHRVGEMDMSGLASGLAALDAQARRQAAAPSLETVTAPCEAALESAERATAATPEETAALQAAVETRREALSALTRAVAEKLSAQGQPAEIGQGLRRLEQIVYHEPQFPEVERPVEAASALQNFDRCYSELQSKARDVLQSSLGLCPMPDQTGQPVDPQLHEVVASEAGTDRSRDNTVTRQEGTGWRLGSEVLVKATVIRYTCAEGISPFPDLGELPAQETDATMWGTRRSSDDEHPQDR